MPYTSIRLPRTVIDDSNWKSFDTDPFIGHQMSRGYVPRDWSTQPLYSTAAPIRVPIIPASDHKEAIREREAKQRTNRELRDYIGLKSLDQNATNYCWFHGVTTGIHYLQIGTGEPRVDLSPASGASVIKQGRNEGGWGNQAIDYCMKHGVAPQALWGQNDRDFRRLDTPEMKQIKLQNRITGFYELKPGQNGWNELVTCLLHGWPVAVAFNWWRHLVCAIDVVIDERGEICILIHNSWGDRWGDRGLSLLKGSKKYPSEAHAVVEKTSPLDNYLDNRHNIRLRTLAG